MAVVNQGYPKFQAFDDSGLPLTGGKVYVYDAGTSDLATIYTAQDGLTQASNPIILDARGEGELWHSTSIKIVLTDSADVQIWSFDNVQANIEPTVTGNHNLIQNGSFEVDSNSDGEPDNWTLAADTNGTISIDSSAGGHIHGANGLKFTSAGSGGGSATSGYIEVQAGQAILIGFALKSSVANNTCIVTVLWYQDDQGTAASTASTAVYNEAAANPTTWTYDQFTATAGADAFYCKIKLEGVHSSGTVTAGRNAIFDDVRVYQGPALFPNITTPPLLNDTEIAILDGATVTTAELNILDGVTSTTAEINTLDGYTGDVDDFNWLDGNNNVKSAVQTQYIVDAGGTANAITADFTPNIALTDKTTVLVRAASASTSTVVTFTPDGLTTKNIRKHGNQNLVPGDIYGADHVLILQYHSGNDVWELLNPYKIEANQLVPTRREITFLPTVAGSSSTTSQHAMTGITTVKGVTIIGAGSTNDLWGVAVTTDEGYHYQFHAAGVTGKAYPATPASGYLAITYYNDHTSSQTLNGYIVVDCI